MLEAALGSTDDMIVQVGNCDNFIALRVGTDLLLAERRGGTGVNDYGTGLPEAVGLSAGLGFSVADVNTGRKVSDRRRTRTTGWRRRSRTATTTAIARA